MRTRTLVLKRETLSALDHGDLVRVAGGTTGTYSDNLPRTLCQCPAGQLTPVVAALVTYVRDQFTNIPVTDLTQDVCDRG